VVGFQAAVKVAETMFRSFGRVRRLFDHTSCAIDFDDRLLCYDGSKPRVVLEGVADASLTPNGPSATGCALMRNGTLQCWAGISGEAGHGERYGGNEPSVVKDLPAIARVSNGTGLTCAIDTRGAVWCFGAHFGPDFVLRARDQPRCRQETATVRIPACHETGPSGDNPCLRFGGSLQDRVVQEVRVIRSGQCVGPGEEFVPWPTRVTLLERARDVVVTPTGGVFFLRDDGVLISVDRADGYKESTVAPRPNDPRDAR
jgi:hypothetical protein